MCFGIKKIDNYTYQRAVCRAILLAINIGESGVWVYFTSHAMYLLRNAGLFIFKPR